MHFFEKEIKEYHFNCKWDKPYLTLTLFNIEQDLCFHETFTNETLPQTVTKYLSTVDETFIFIQTSGRFFKVTGPGEILIAHYLVGNHQKNITFKLKPQPIEILPNQIFYLTFLKKEIYKLQSQNNKYKKTINFQQTLLEQSKSQIKNLKMSLGKKNRADSLGKEEPIEEQKPGNAIDCDVVDAMEERTTRLRAKYLKQFCTSGAFQAIKDVQNLKEINISTAEDGNKRKRSRQNKKTGKYKVMEIEHKEEEEVFYNFEISKDCPYLSRFKVSPFSAEKVISTDSYQLYGSEPLNEPKTSFMLRLKRSKYGNLIVGIIGSENLQKKCSNFISNTICYDGYYGIVINNTAQDENQYRKLKQNDVIKTTIDLQKRQIQWFINSDYIASASIPLNMRLPLFPFFQLFDKGDIVSFKKQQQPSVKSQKYNLRNNGASN